MGMASFFAKFYARKNLSPIARQKLMEREQESRKTILVP